MPESSASLRLEPGENGSLLLHGSLTFASVADGWRIGQDALRNARPACLDLSGLEKNDSAGLACILAWLAFSRQRGVEIQVVNAPESLCALARVSDAQRWICPAETGKD